MKRFARLLLCGLAATLLTAASGYQVNYGANQDITEWSTCKNVANAHASGKAIFVPTNTSTEWTQFYTHAPAGVTIASCSCTVTAGSQSFTTAGSSNFTIPCFNTLTVAVWGGGGGGGGYSGGTGGDGGQSSWDGALIANGGNNGVSTNGAGGAGGTASGGTTNTTGSSGQAGTSAHGGAGGAGANGGAGGGQQTSTANGKAGSAPGGGGGGGHYSNKYGGYGGGGGGGGGYATRSYSPGSYTVGSNVAVVVGNKGAGANGSTEDGGAGAIGRVTVTWN